MLKTKYFLSSYIILGILVITSQLIGWHDFQNLTKPLLMPFLIVFYVTNNKKPYINYDFLILGALFFSMLGDVFLMPYFNIFLAGLGSFLIAHFLYIIAFLKEKKPLTELTKNNKILILAGFTATFILLIILLNKLIGDSPLVLIMAVTIYATTLFLLFITSIIRKPKFIKSYEWVLIGASLFLISDSFLAINKFVLELPYSPILVMTTYISAQAFLMFGSLRRNG